MVFRWLGLLSLLFLSACSVGFRVVVPLERCNTSVCYAPGFGSKAETTSATITDTHLKFEQLFGQEIVLPDTRARILKREDFLAETGLPSWVAATYRNSDKLISLPMPNNDFVDTVRHEYSHAIVDELSGGNCPNWLSEGIAMWIEQDDHGDNFEKELQDLVKKEKRPVPLYLLQDSFTHLKENVVSAAYGQSLFSTQILIRRFGFKVIGSYLAGLKENVKDHERIFINNFGITESDFEKSAYTILVYNYASRKSRTFSADKRLAGRGRHSGK